MKHFNEINALNICPLFKLFRIEGMLTLRVLGFILLESKICSELKKEMKMSLAIFNSTLFQYDFFCKMRII